MKNRIFICLAKIIKYFSNIKPFQNTSTFTFSTINPLFLAVHRLRNADLIYTFNNIYTVQY